MKTSCLRALPCIHAACRLCLLICLSNKGNGVPEHHICGMEMALAFCTKAAGPGCPANSPGETDEGGCLNLTACPPGGSQETCARQGWTRARRPTGSGTCDLSERRARPPGARSRAWPNWSETARGNPMSASRLLMARHTPKNRRRPASWRRVLRMLDQDITRPAPPQHHGGARISSRR